MKKNEIVTVKITSLNSDCAGVGRIDNEVVFVPYALPEETVEALIIKEAKNYSVGKLLKVITPSEHRREPLCPVFYRCGGCALQHLEYNAQLNQKCDSTIKNINKISGLELKISEIIGADQPWHYRAKAQFPCGKDRNGDFVVGFFSSRSHNIVPIDSCYLQDERCNKVISAVKKAVETANLSIYNEDDHTGILRHIIVRCGKKGVMVIAVTNSAEKLPQKFVKAILSFDSEITTVVQNINTQKGNIILGKKCITLFGDGFIEDELCKIKFKLSPLAFLQVNPGQAEKLYNKAISLASLTGKETVFDAYCGIGVMSLCLAKKSKKLIGVEIIPEAIDSAKEAAKMNGIENAEFISGACEDILPYLLKNGNKPDVLVVDPPRAGCEESLLKAIAENDIKKIVYVSCNPSTLARDIKIFAFYGYSCSDVTFVDMFCQTKHVETVVLLTKVQ